MKAKKFIAHIKEYLGLEEFEKKSKRKSVKILLKKLEIKYAELLQQLKNSSDEKELQEELEIIALHIKKAENILQKLNDKKEQKEDKS